MFGFLFWLFFIGIIIATLQDLKRREVDNWLNLFLLIASVSYLFFEYFSYGDFIYSIVLLFFVGLSAFFYFYNGNISSGIEKQKKKYYFWLFSACLLAIIIVLFFVKFFGVNDMPFFIIVASSFLVMFVVSNLFYEGRVFAGGDTKLLFVMTAFFVGISFFDTLINIGVFLLFLMFSGSVYGIIYSFVLYIKDFKKINKEIKKELKSLVIGYWMFGIGFVLILFGFFNLLFSLIGFFIVAILLLYVFAKGIEKISMIKNVSGKELREGDWLVSDIKVNGKVIKADWDGLSSLNIELLKGKKKVLIKNGLPFVPAFLIAFLAYVFFKGWFLGIIFGL